MFCFSGLLSVLERHCEGFVRSNPTSMFCFSGLLPARSSQFAMTAGLFSSLRGLCLKQSNISVLLFWIASCSFLAVRNDGWFVFAIVRALPEVI